MTPSFTDLSRLKISSLRGAYLDMSADLEFLLVDLICVCLIKNEKERNYVKEILISKSMLQNKINFAKSALTIYNPSYAKEYKDTFKAFEKLNKIRNKLSHTTVEGDPLEIDLDMAIFVKFKNGEKDLSDVQSINNLKEDLKWYAEFIHGLGNLFQILYAERHMTRYHNVLQFPSNRSLSFWSRKGQNVL